jgi:8-oxo-dGTP diphosphatase
MRARKSTGETAMASKELRTLLVVAAIIKKNGRYLLAQRKENCKSAPGKWEFPGGKVESGEDPKEALIREIKEELDITIGNLRIFDVTSSVNPPGSRYPHIIMISYLADWKSGKIRLLDCKDAKMVEPRKLDKFDLIEGDAEIVRNLKKNSRKKKSR